MILVHLLLVASVGCAGTVNKNPSSQSNTVSISAKREDDRTYITAKIPYGQTLQISCPQKDSDTPSSGEVLQTVQIDGAKYLIPEGTTNCKSSGILFNPEIRACNATTSTSCTIPSNDSSKKEGCTKRHLGIRYFCADSAAPPPPGVGAVMVNNMIDDSFG